MYMESSAAPSDFTLSNLDRSSSNSLIFQLPLNTCTKRKSYMGVQPHQHLWPSVTLKGKVPHHSRLDRSIFQGVLLEAWSPEAISFDPYGVLWTLRNSKGYFWVTFHVMFRNWFVKFKVSQDQLNQYFKQYSMSKARTRAWIYAGV